ncbi:hypothetical protein GTP45_00620 [Pseudoduganella sp. FT55W]|uniref:Uncharacterized protein n=1 Tax=Duganella rivi TaxID=2666083 RepID=A0A7X4K9M1_9BURK|nr:hypothetical protein [Duganella rivi]MYM65334.1 hypothetical protein [Duganella rivi]
MRWSILLMAIAANAAHADGAADLKAALERLQEQAPLKATLDASVWRKEGEGKEAEEVNGQASVGIEDGARGMQLSYSREMLARLDAEAVAQARNPNAKTPTLTASRDFSPNELRPMVAAAAVLAQHLEKAVFKSEKVDSFQGKPARMLTYAQGMDVISDRQRKYVKDFEGNIFVWIGADGTPLGSRLVQNFSGRAFLVVSFSGKTEEQSVYSVAGKRLITTRLESRGNNAGAGEKSEFKTVKTLQLVP